MRDTDTIAAECPLRRRIADDLLLLLRILLVLAGDLGLKRTGQVRRQIVTDRSIGRRRRIAECRAGRCIVRIRRRGELTEASRCGAGRSIRAG